MSQYDVRVYVPKELYQKLHYIASSGQMSVSMLLGKIIRDDSVVRTIDGAYDIIKALQEGKGEVVNERVKAIKEAPMDNDGLS